MNNPPEVSVIINCYNEAEFLRETLDSVFGQTFQDWEIVFWDNGSSDGSGEIAASYGERVRCFRSDPTVPLGRARKLAYEETRGDYVAILDADDIWRPQKLERQLELFRSDPQVGMTYCDATYFDDSGDRYRLFRRTTPHRGQVFGKLLAKNFIFSSTMMFRRDALTKLGHAFNDRFIRAQDYDLSLRVAYNFPIDYVDEPLLRWRINGTADKPYKTSLVPREAEIQSALEGLVESYPEIKLNYGAELRSLQKDIDYAFGVNAWQGRNLSQARSYFARHLSDKKFVFVYFCTLLVPLDLFVKVKNFYRNVTGKR